jgi:hypothetical protein
MFNFLLISFGGGGGGSPDLPPVEKPVETRRVVERAGEAKEAERKRVPPGRKSTMFAGIEKMLTDRQLKNELGQ